MTVTIRRGQLRRNVQFDELRRLKRRTRGETECRTRIRSPYDTRARVDAASVTVEGAVIGRGRVVKVRRGIERVAQGSGTLRLRKCGKRRDRRVGRRGTAERKPRLIRGGRRGQLRLQRFRSQRELGRDFAV